MQAIPTGAKFALAGTEVFHVQCVSDIARSVGTRNRLHIVQLGRTNDHANARIVELQREIAAKDHAERDLRLARAELHQVNAKLKRLNRDMDEIVDDMRRQRDVARAELALFQDLSGARESAPPVTTQTPVPTPVDSPTGPANDQRDDAEQRFSLLELDPLK